VGGERKGGREKVGLREVLHLLAGDVSGGSVQKTENRIHPHGNRAFPRTVEGGEGLLRSHSKKGVAGWTPWRYKGGCGSTHWAFSSCMV